MGGAMGVGNTGPVQEFNIHTDPEAAKIVFESGVPLAMVPIEVCSRFAAIPHSFSSAESALQSCISDLMLMTLACTAGAKLRGLFRACASFDVDTSRNAHADNAHSAGNA